MKTIQTLVLFSVAAFGAYAAPSCASRDFSAEETVLCPDCGMEKGAEGCGSPDAARCPDCGKIEGSPGCGR